MANTSCQPEDTYNLDSVQGHASLEDSEFSGLGQDCLQARPFAASQELQPTRLQRNKVCSQEAKRVRPDWAIFEISWQQIFLQK